MYRKEGLNLESKSKNLFKSTQNFQFVKTFFYANLFKNSELCDCLVIIYKVYILMVILVN